MRALIAAAAKACPQIKVEVRRTLLAVPLIPQPGSARIAAAIQRHAKAVLGVDVAVTGVPLYTDARHYAAHGIPIVLYGAGPRSILEANAHNANENLRLNDLSRRYQDRGPGGRRFMRDAAIRQRPRAPNHPISGRSDRLMRVTMSSQARFSRSGYLRSKQCTAPPAFEEKLQRL